MTVNTEITVWADDYPAGKITPTQDGNYKVEIRGMKPRFAPTLRLAKSIADDMVHAGPDFYEKEGPDPSPDPGDWRAEGSKLYPDDY